jgi:amidase
MMSEQISGFSTATAMLAALEAKRISTRELLQLHEERIARHNAALNVIVERDQEATRTAASEADARRARGELGALTGLPITLKESMNVKGMRTTVGVEMWARERATDDGAIAARTRAAGAVLLGKTNVAPMLADWQANNPIYGRTNNPWDLSRSPGGSTGGSAAVAAGLTPLEYGSDIGGSIRVPAAFCGVYGHRPSETALPRSGQFPGALLPNAAAVLAVQGPLARSAEDLELGFAAVAGADAGEDVAWRLQLPAPRHSRLSEFRVAVLPQPSWVPLAAEIAESQERLSARLAAIGCKVAQAQPEVLGDHREAFDLYQTLLTAMTTAGTPSERRQKGLELLQKRDDREAAARARGLAGSAGDYLVWHRERERLRAGWRDFFRNWDVLISPAFCSLAYPHFEYPWPPNPSRQQLFDFAGEPAPYDYGLFFPSIATLPGQPATSFPVGLSRNGLPVGLQAIGPYLEDYTVLQFVKLVAREWGGFLAPPSFA